MKTTISVVHPGYGAIKARLIGRTLRLQEHFYAEEKERLKGRRVTALFGKWKLE